MKRFTAAFLAVLLPLFLMAASTQIDWTQIKNKPSIPSAFWNDPGSGTLLKRIGAFTFAAAVSNTDYQAALGFTPENSANKGGVSGYAPLDGSSKVPAANLPSAWNDPGAGTFLKRIGAFTFGTAATADFPQCVASGASHASGLVPDPGASAGTTKFLREDCTFAVPSSSGISTQNELHASKAIGTVYQNTGTTARFVTVTLNLAGTSLAGGANVFTDASNPPTTEVASAVAISNTNSVTFPVTFIVLPSNFYKLTAAGSTATLIAWTEWQ